MTGSRRGHATGVRGESLRGTHLTLGEEGVGAGWCGHEAQTAHGGAVCRAPPARPGQNLPAGWRRGLRSQPTGPQSISQGEAANQLLSPSAVFKEYLSKQYCLWGDKHTISTAIASVTSYLSVIVRISRSSI